MRIYLVAYAPTSPQRLVDLAKLAFSLSFVEALVVVKASGMAAQVGIPEVSKLAYKLDKKLIILPQLQDIKDVLQIDKVLIVVRDEEAQSIEHIEMPSNGRIAVVVQAGEVSIPRQELAIGEPVKIPFLGRAPPIPVADAVMSLFILSQKFHVAGDESRL